jgi:hypothetical protein
MKYRIALHRSQEGFSVSGLWRTLGSDLKSQIFVSGGADCAVVSDVEIAVPNSLRKVIEKGKAPPNVRGIVRLFPRKREQFPRHPVVISARLMYHFHFAHVDLTSRFEETPAR